MTKKVISIFLALLLALSTFAVTASAYDRMDLDDLMMQLDQARMQAMMDGKLSDDLYWRIDSAVESARFCEDWDIDSWYDQLNSLMDELNGGGGNYPAEWGAISGRVIADWVDISFDNIEFFNSITDCRVTDSSGNDVMVTADGLGDRISIQGICADGTYTLTAGTVDYMTKDMNMGVFENLSITFTVNTMEETISFGGSGGHGGSGSCPAEWGAASGRWENANVYITFANVPFFYGCLGPSLKNSMGEEVFAYIDAYGEHIIVEGIYDSGTYTLSFERVAVDMTEYENVSITFTYDAATGNVTISGGNSEEQISTELSYPAEFGDLEFFGDAFHIHFIFSDISNFFVRAINASVTDITTGEKTEWYAQMEQSMFSVHPPYTELAPGDYVLSGNVDYDVDYDHPRGHFNIPFSVDSNGIAYMGDGYLSDTCVYPASFGLLGGWAEEGYSGIEANIFFSEKDEFDFIGIGNVHIFDTSTGNRKPFGITFNSDIGIINIFGAWETITPGTYTLYCPAFVHDSDHSFIKAHICIVFTIHDDYSITFFGQADHLHSFSTDWAYNDEYHWHPCVNEACDLNKKVEVEYVDLETVFTTSAAEHTDEDGDFYCDVCAFYDKDKAETVLPAARLAAVEELTDYAGSEAPADILAIVESGTAAINNAQSVDDVEDAKIAAMKAIADITLATPRADAITAIESALGENPSAAVLAVFAAAEDEINNALTDSDVTEIKEQALADIAAQLELEEAQSDAITALEEAAGENPSAAVLAVVVAAEDEINNAISASAITAIKEQALADIAAQLALEAARADAIAELEEAAGENPSAEILAILEEAQRVINGADNADAIAKSMDAALDEIAAQLAFENAQASAITALETAAGKNPSADIIALIEAAEAQINAAESEEAIDEIALTAVKAIAIAALEDAAGNSSDYAVTAIMAFAADRLANAATVEDVLAEQQQALAAVAKQTAEETYSTEWSVSATHHWHDALDENSDRVSGFGAHTFGTDGKCTVCGYEKQAGEKKYTVVLTGISNPDKNYSGATDDNGICNIENIENGTYLMAISCEGAVTRTYTTEITDGTIRQDIELYDDGDVNGDGEITVEDYSAAVNAALAGDNEVPEDLSLDADYSKAVADIDCDGVVDVLDIAMLERKVNA